VGILVLTDTVEKIADEPSEPFHLTFWVFFSLGLPTSLAELVTLAKASNACCTLDAWDAQATHAAGVFSRGGQIYLASVFKFKTATPASTRMVPTTKFIISEYCYSCKLIILH
jgi:hypothetical protein